MAENIRLLRPPAGQQIVVLVGPDARLEIAFKTGDPNLHRDGQDLVFRFDDDSLINLQGFYDNFGENAQPPTLIVGDYEISGVAFIAALSSPDIRPCPCSDPQPPVSGGFYEEALLHGVGGVSCLGKLSLNLMYDLGVTVGDTLRANDLFGGDADALNALLATVRWDEALHAFKGELAGSSIILALDAGKASLNLQVADGPGRVIVLEDAHYAQQVQHDDLAAQQLVHDLIKVGGNS